MPPLVGGGIRSCVGDDDDIDDDDDDDDDGGKIVFWGPNGGDGLCWCREEKKEKEKKEIETKDKTIEIWFKILIVRRGHTDQYWLVEI